MPGVVYIYKETLSSGQKHSCTYELTAVGTTCAEPTQAQARPNPNVVRGVRNTIPPQATKLLAVASFWERERPFSLS